VCRQTAWGLRRRLQANGEQLQPITALSDARTETDEMFQNAGKKGDRIAIPTPHPTPSQQTAWTWMYENDHSPIVGTVGRETGQVRLRVVHHTDEKTLC